MSARPSPGWVFSLVAAAAGLTFAAVALQAEWEGRRGGDPLNAINQAGAAGFAAGCLLLFGSRLIVWDKASASLRTAARAAVAVALVGVVLAAATAVVGLGGARTGALAVGSAILAALCQFGSLAWLVRYRRE